MLNVEKVKNMTMAATYEKSPEKKNIEIGSYFRADYLGLQMVKSAVAYTLAFGILLAMWAAGRMSELMLLLSRAEYIRNLMKIVIALFAIGLVLYECGVYVFFSIQYEKAKKSIKDYNHQLKQIQDFYETQESDGDVLVIEDYTDEENGL